MSDALWWSMPYNPWDRRAERVEADTKARQMPALWFWEHRTAGNRWNVSLQVGVDLHDDEAAWISDDGKDIYVGLVGQPPPGFWRRVWA